MTVVRRVERCPDHDIPASFLLDGTRLRPGTTIIDTACPIRGCRFAFKKSEPKGLIRLPIIDPPLVIEP